MQRIAPTMQTDKLADGPCKHVTSPTPQDLIRARLSCAATGEGRPPDTTMRSDIIKKGFERAPHRSLLRATGSIESEADWEKPFIAIANSYTDCIPGHAHLNEVGLLVKRLVRAAGHHLGLHGVGNPQMKPSGEGAHGVKKNAAG